MTRYVFMTPAGMYGGSFEAENDEDATRIAKAAPWHEKVLDITEGSNGDILLVVADERGHS